MPGRGRREGARWWDAAYQAESYLIVGYLVRPLNNHQMTVPQYRTYLFRPSKTDSCGCPTTPPSIDQLT